MGRGEGREAGEGEEELGLTCKIKSKVFNKKNMKKSFKKRNM